MNKNKDLGASADADRATHEQSPHAVSAVPVGIPSACNFCGATPENNPGRVIQHENGAAICSDCVAAAVLSLANYAAQAIEARRAETGTGSVVDESAVPEGNAPKSSAEGDNHA